jgi:hypothetical protein
LLGGARVAVAAATLLASLRSGRRRVDPGPKTPAANRIRGSDRVSIVSKHTAPTGCERPPGRREWVAVGGSFAANVGLAITMWVTGGTLLAVGATLMIAGVSGWIVASRADHGYVDLGRVLRVLDSLPLPLWISLLAYLVAPAAWVVEVIAHLA